jgi:hypothetical protein
MSPNLPTHIHGHTLDWIVSRSEDNLVHDIKVLPRYATLRYSDHFIVTCNLRCDKPPPLKIITTSREYGKIDHSHLVKLLHEQFIDFPQNDDPNFLNELYESKTLSVLDEVCPLITKERIVKHRLPWYNDNIHAARRVRRQLERKWRKSRLEEDHEVFVAQKDHVCKLINDSKIAYYSEKCTNASVKDMYVTINGLLNKPRKVLPDCDSNKDLANSFSDFFTEKVENIRAKVGSHHSMQNAHDNATCSSSLNEFKLLTSADVEKIIMRFPSKFCLLDTFPSWLVKDNLQTLLPVITQIVNISLASGVFPESLKTSIINPIYKKSTLDANELKSYRPIANMKFLSKIIEKAASCQVIDHVDGNNLSEVLQSSYKCNHSTETALIKVQSDILQSLDCNKAVFMVLLDMTAAFDTVDHHIFLARLKSHFGIDGQVLSFFKTYLSNRTTRVVVNNEFSFEKVLTYSLPQGSIIGPHGFTMYITPVSEIIRKNDISFHEYADDFQLYAEFDPKVDGDCQRVLEKLSECISQISSWMSSNYLQLNQEKTEFIIIANPRVLPSLANIALKIGELYIQPSSSVKNLGVFLDCHLNMSNHVNSLCKTVNFHIRNLWRIRRFITQEACHHAVRGLVLSRLDYANSLMFGLRQVDLNRLQRLQNKAARLVFACGRDRSSAVLLDMLHWLPVKERILYKMSVLIFKCIHNTAPPYLQNLIQCYNDPVVSESRPRLRSSKDTTRLVVPRSKRKAGDRSFVVASPSIWNGLPVDLRESASEPVFKRKLKTHLYPSPL